MTVTLPPEAINARLFCVGNGTTDDTAALQSLLNDGGDIYLPYGTSYYTTGLTIPVSGTRLYGPGTLVWSNSSTHGVAVNEHVTDVTLEGFTVNALNAGESAGVAVNLRGLRHTVRGLYIHDAPTAGVQVYGDLLAETTLTSLVSPGTQVLPVASSSGFVVGASVQLSPGTSRTEESIVTEVGSGTITLDHPCARSHNSGDAVTQSETQHVQICDCKVFNAAGEGIYLATTLASGIDAPAHCSIIGNHVDLPGLAGINAEALHLVIANNVINAPGSISPHADGITFYAYGNENTLVTGNLIYNSGNNGIHGGGSRVQVANNTVHTVWGSSGIFVSSSPNSGPTFSRDVVITGNKVYNVLDSSGIIIYGYQSVVIGSNEVDTVYAYGISVADNSGNASPQVADSISITGNSIQNSQTNDGIHVLSATRAAITGNTITDCNQHGVYITDNSGSLQSADYAIAGNVINNCPSGAVVTSGTPTRVLASGNAVRNCGSTPFSNGGVAYGMSVIGNLTDLATTIASAATLVVPLGQDVVHISGTTVITSISASSGYSGRRITLIFNSACTVENANNIHLNGAVNYNAPVNGSLSLVCDESGNWYDATRTNLSPNLLLPTAPNVALAESLSRHEIGSASGPAITSGTPLLVAIPVSGGIAISGGAFFFSASDSGRSHLWYALCDASLNVLAKTADDTGGTITADAMHSLEFTSKYSVSTEGHLYLALINVATTVATVAGRAGLSQLLAMAPAIEGNSSSTGQTTPGAAPSQFGALTSGTAMPYAYIY